MMKKTLMILLLVASVFLLFSCARTTRKLPIATLSNLSEYHGTFVLGTGSIGGSEYIYSWALVGNGYIRLKIYIAEAKICLDEDEAPYVNVYSDAVDGDVFFEFHVPKNTILQKYQLN
jgi:hypothetical protein